MPPKNFFYIETHVGGKKRIIYIYNRNIPMYNILYNFMLTLSKLNKKINQLFLIDLIYNLYLEATPGFEPGIRVLQTRALPLGYVAEML